MSPRASSILKWTATLLTLMVLASWGASGLWRAQWQWKTSYGTRILLIHAGSISYSEQSGTYFIPPVQFRFHKQPAEFKMMRRLMFRRDGWKGGFWLFIPLLTPGIALSCVSARLWWRGARLHLRKRRLTEGLCPGCGYDLVNARAGGVCPECGAKELREPTT